MKSVGYYPSPLGMLRITYEGSVLFTLDFCREQGTGPIPEDAKRWLDRYFAGLDPGEIPPFRFPEVSGQTVTYGELAAKMAARGFGKCPQAVGGAVGSNPISLMVPCHRVVGSGGRLTGYAWGLERKKALLDLEQGHPL